MVARVLDGKACAEQVKQSLKPRIAKLAELGVVPHLAVIIVGEDPASQIYVRAKVRTCKNLGIESTHISMPEDSTWVELSGKIAELNANDSVHGILVQSPLPDGIDELALTDLIDPNKDVDGFHPANLGRLVQGRDEGLIPCTPNGIIRLLQWGGVELAGKRAVVIGRSRIVGMPVALLLARKGADATVTVVHSRSADIAGICREAEVIIAAVGRAEFIQPDWVSEGAVVVDVGVNRIDDPSSESEYRLTGDVHPDVAEVAGALSPVPGGVGPMTIAMLMLNTVTAAENTLS